MTILASTVVMKTVHAEVLRIDSSVVFMGRVTAGQIDGSGANFMNGQIIDKEWNYQAPDGSHTVVQQATNPQNMVMTGHQGPIPDKGLGVSQKIEGGSNTIQIGHSEE